MALRRGFFRRFLHRPVQVKFPEFLSLPVGEGLREKLSALDSDKKQNLRDISSSDTATQLSGTRYTTELRARRDHVNQVLQIQAFAAPPLPLRRPQEQVPVAAGNSLRVTETKKILRMYQVEKLKARLREIPESCVSRTKFLKICEEGGGNDEQVSELARSLDESGSVIVFGDIVFLRPEQMAKSMEALINQTWACPDDPRRTELAQLERTKAMIDQRAQKGVRAELRCGLGLLAAQTLGFMRLTFWELSWDVMEPICFFVTSLHFILGYAFFLRTSTEPSFDGFTQRRFKIRQKKLMEIHGFNVGRYNELKMLFYQPSSSL